ncbi:hypothetical protein A2U01_0109307, partial [Trifolium medium]|nr:hypothetical protein [Trifolium medium]
MTMPSMLKMKMKHHFKRQFNHDLNTNHHRINEILKKRVMEEDRVICPYYRVTISIGQFRYGMQK